jgi:hypothetical protein
VDVVDTYTCAGAIVESFEKLPLPKKEPVLVPVSVLVPRLEHVPVFGPSGPFYDKEKLDRKINEYFETIERTYPCIHMYAEDIKMIDDLPMGRLKYNEGTGPYCWLFHDTEEAFRSTCAVLANVYCVKPELLETAFWLLVVHYMDGEDEHTGGRRYLNTYICQAEYGVCMNAAFEMVSHYGSIRIKNAANIAMILEKGV